MQKASDFIELFQLEKHPEGGYFKETYRSSERIIREGGHQADAATTIYYLLEGEQRSAFHRIDCDEQWFFHAGQTLEICSIQNGKWRSEMLGSEAGGQFQVMIPANTWFTAGIKNKTGFMLASCVVAPGFEFSGFELAEKELLIKEFPHLVTKIEECYR